jgi:hypothetical protein
MTHRTSFAGALVTMALGAVLAFAVQGSPKYLDIHVAGLILVLGAAADLTIRAVISDSPLLSQETADVAAVVEPVGEPVLDAAGNPIVVANPASAPARPPLVAPPPGTRSAGPMPETLIVTDEPYYPTVASPPAAGLPRPSSAAAAARREAAVGGAEIIPGAVPTPPEPESPVAVTTLTGRPVRPRSGPAAPRRRWRRGRW